MNKKSILSYVIAIGAMIYFSGQLGYGNLFKVLAAYGYGGGIMYSASNGGGGGSISTVPTVTSFAAPGVFVPLTVGRTQNGNLSQSLPGNARVDLAIPTGAVSGVVTFNVSAGQMSANNAPANTVGAFMVGNQIFNINASASNGDAVRSFEKNLSITLVVPGMPASDANLGVYYFNDTTNSWVLVPGARFDTLNGKVSFEVNHLTKFAIMKVSGVPSNIAASGRSTDTSGQVNTGGNGKVYADGNLLRATDGKIYIIENQTKKLISSLTELKRYTGQKIYSVSYDILNTYKTVGSKTPVIDIIEPVKKPNSNVVTAPVVPVFNNGELIRGLDGRIFVIDNGKKVKVDSLAELGAYRGKPIKEVTDRVLTSYADANALSEGNLVRKMDMKVYVIKNGIKQHVVNLSELAKYAGKKIFNVVESVFNR